MSLAILPVLPLIAIAATIVVGMIALSVRRNHRFVFCVTLLGIIASSASIAAVAWMRPQQGSFLFVADGLALFSSLLLLAGAFTLAVLSYDYLEGRTGFVEEYYLLFLGALLGTLVLVSSRHFVSFFLGLETLSVSLYALIGYDRTGEEQTEGAIKYLILSGVSSAFLLFGMAMIYGLAGTMDFDRLASSLVITPQELFLALSALVFVMVGMGFKLGVAPFHMWTPDVYKSAPAPVTGFIATLSKGSVLVLLVRFLENTGLSGQPKLFAILAVISVASMLVGNLLALFQKSVKRLLACSSIAHFGYLLVPFLSVGPLRVTALICYLVAYFVATIGAFGIVALLSTKEEEADSMEHYSGLFRRRPVIAGSFSLMLLSLAGMPFTAGFIAKAYAVAAGTASILWIPLLSLIVTSAISLFYYLRLIIVMFDEEGKAALRVPLVFPLKAKVVVALLVGLLLWWGVYPVQLIRVIELINIGY